jgi:nucleoside-diphosphate-sugar epimerase
MRRLIAGCGYLGSRVARLWQARGDVVHVLTRSAARARHFQQQGWHPWVGDLAGPAALPRLPSVDTVLWSVGFDPVGPQTAEEVKLQGLQRFFGALPNDVGRFIYISSTGVYGETDGSEVTELTECRPRRPGGHTSLAAEQLLLQSPFASRSVILRLAGLYGPHRLPRLKQLQAGQPLEASPTDLLNLIHVDDAAQVVERAAEHTLELPRIFLVADGQPVLRADFYQEVARVWKTPPPVFHSAADPPRGSHRRGGCKRVCNARMRSELNITLRYPSFRHALENDRMFDVP